MNDRLSNSARVCSCVLIQQCDRWEESAKHLRCWDRDLKIVV